MACVTVPLAPACVNITGVRANDRNVFQITITSGGAPLDLTGATLTAQARTSTTATDVLMAEVTVVDAVAGVVQVRWPGDDVNTWLAGEATRSGVWDLQIDDGVDPDPLCVVEGTFEAQMDVTRP